MADLLNERTLGQARHLSAPLAYTRDRLHTGIVHVGLGAFHRAHQAVYTELLIAGGDLRWGCLGVSLRDPAVAQTLAAQDTLYTVTEREGDAARTQLIGGIRAAVFAPTALETVLSAIAAPSTHIVSTTVTEKGYCRLPSSSDLDLGDPGIQHDLAHPDAPRTTLGVLAAGLRRRPASAPLTMLCCDNMPANGRVLRRLLAQFADRIDPALARRIERDVAFPSSMVDRIVPAATAQSLQWAEERIGLRDQAAVVCESFTQWVIEDAFAGPRPAWEEAGAVLTRDVEPYEAMKLRLLNGTHSAIAYAGQLCGLATVSDAMADPDVGRFARDLMAGDLLSSVTAPAGFDAGRYCQDLLRRFANPALGHRTQQIAMDGTQKVPVRWLPALRQAALYGARQPLLERALALWLHYLWRREDDAGQALVVSDPGAAALTERLREAGDAPGGVRAVLACHDVFGDTPWPDAWVGRVAGHLDLARQAGARAVVRSARDKAD